MLPEALWPVARDVGLSLVTNLAAGMTGEPLRSGVDHYLASLRNERRLSPHTASNYGRDLASLLDYCTSQGITSWQQLDPQHIRMFAAREHRRGLAPRSIQRRIE